MKVVYTGKTKEFTPQLEKKVEAKLSKLGRMIEQRGEREAHVFHQEERHLHKVEVKLNIYDRQLCGVSSAGDLLTAVTEAVENLDKQIIKLRTRWRDTHRDSNNTRATKAKLIEKAQAAAPVKTAAGPIVQTKSQGRAVAKTAPVKRIPRVFTIAYGKGQKPMSLEEAILSLDNGEDYVVYRDVDKDALTVLVRRRDGHLDLIET